MEDAAAGLITFPGLAHRMETVGQSARSSSSTTARRPTPTRARQAMRPIPSSTGSSAAAEDGGIDSLADLFPRVAKAYLVGEAATISPRRSRASALT
jgi:UDP-N-acetylmuramoylalanine--D-glutamate ligase